VIVIPYNCRLQIEVIKFPVLFL